MTAVITAYRGEDPGSVVVRLGRVVFRAIGGTLYLQGNGPSLLYEKISVS